MKLFRIDLKAFGPFSNAMLDLSDGSEGLHLIYGPNEAGKSSALRAIRNLLYGIPDRSPDDFLHPYGKLRIGGKLGSGTGGVLEFIRRKGRSVTLRGPDDSTLVEESVLSGLLGGVDEDDFAKRFGIDHETLVLGGREIVEGGGELASILFAAGSGMPGFRAVQEGLKSEMDALFKPNASKPRINEALARFRDEQKNLRESQLSSHTWVLHDKAYREAVERKRVVQAQFEAKSRELARLERISKALPVTGRWKSLQQELEPYSQAVLLPPEFSRKRQETLTALKMEEQNERIASEALAGIDAELACLSVPDLLIENADEIDQLHRDLGGISKAAADRPGLAVKRELHDEQAKEILAGLRTGFPLDRVDSLRVETAQQVRIRKLGEKREKVLARLESALENVERLGRSADSLEKHLRDVSEPPDTTGLKLAVEDAKRLGKIEEELVANREEIRKMEKDAAMGIGALGLPGGPLEEIERLPVPDAEAINDFDSRLRDGKAEVQKHQGEIERLEDELLKIRRDLDQLRIEREVPTEDDLVRARRKRDDGWQFIRNLVEGGPEKEANEGGSVPRGPGPDDIAGTFEKTLHAADEIADRLRREADRVARYAAFLSDRENREAQIERVRTKKAVAETELGAANAGWVRLWETVGVRTDSPVQMRRWAERHRKLSEISVKIRELGLKADAQAELIKKHGDNLAKCLNETGRKVEDGEGLSRLLARCQMHLDEFDQIRRRRDQLGRDMQNARQELEAARILEDKSKTGLNEWKDEWEQAILPLGLGRESIPDQANEILGRLQELFEKLRAAKEFRTRIEGIDSDAAEFKKRTRQFLHRVAPDLAELPAEEGITIVYGRLSQAKTANAQKKSLQKRRVDETGKKTDAAQRAARFRVLLRAMCDEAGCEEFDELQEAERLSSEKRKLAGQFEEVRAQLIDLASGMELESFIMAARAEDPDSMNLRIGLLEEELAVLNDTKSSIDQAIGRESNELGRMNGGAGAAEIAQEVQALLAVLGTEIKHYCHLKVASVMLSDAVEKYRQRSQGPVLRRASELFREMTLRSFDGLQVEMDDKGNSIITGVRGGGKEAVKAGGMSEGTADQLYLALRLASLDHHMESNEPLPFILDDILIRFDNERAAATLKILAHLSERTQVIYFTHHRHLVEQAKSAVDPGKLFIHSLGG
jgi:uncharacterized protein YhaN